MIFKEKDFETLANQTEYSSFLRNALAWKGTITPKILPRVIWAGAYSTIILLLMIQFPQLSISITPFEYTGAVLGLLLVARVNAGVERWWEARKIWGNIVNQSRNLATVVAKYTEGNDKIAKETLNWIALWPHTMMHHLRNERSPSLYKNFISDQDIYQLCTSHHMPISVSLEIADKLAHLKGNSLDDFSSITGMSTNFDSSFYQKENIIRSFIR